MASGWSFCLCVAASAAKLRPVVIIVALAAVWTLEKEWTAVPDFVQLSKILYTHVIHSGPSRPPRMAVLATDANGT